MLTMKSCKMVVLDAKFIRHLENNNRSFFRLCQELVNFSQEIHFFLIPNSFQLLTTSLFNFASLLYTVDCKQIRFTKNEGANVVNTYLRSSTSVHNSCPCGGHETKSPAVIERAILLLNFDMPLARGPLSLLKICIELSACHVDLIQGKGIRT